MAERTVKVNLIAQVNGYIAGMEAAAKKTRDLGSEAEKLAAKRQAFEDLGRPLLAFGAIAAAAVGIAIKKFADFDQALSNVQAATQGTTEDLALMRDAALDAGGKTVFTATEAANALEELGKASFDTQTSIAALDGALALAASGQLDVARAAEITATTLKQFQLEGSQAGHVADVLSAGAGKALGSVDDLAEGLKYIGPVAHSMGISLEETVGALALFADQGILGEQAGTALRGVLSSLTSPSKEAAAEIDRLNINLYDSGNAFIGLEGLAGQLGNAYQTMDAKSRDASLGLIFGNQQVTAARVLFQGGADAIHKYTTEVNDAGYAAKVAATRMDNLKGDVEKLGGAFDTALIKSGSGANDVLRELVQGLTFLVDSVGGLPEPVLNAGLAVGAIAAAIALTGGAALVAVPRVVAFKTAMVNTQIGAKGAALAVGAVGAAIGIATVLVTAFISAQAQADGVTNELRDSLDQTTGALTDYSREIIAKKLVENGAVEQAKRLGISQEELTDAIMNGGTALDEIKGKTSGDFFSSLGFQSVGLTGKIDELATGVVQSKKDFDDLKAAIGPNTTAVDKFSGKVQTATFDLKGLKEIIEGFGSAQLDVNAATRGFESAIDSLTDSVTENGQTLDLTTEAGRNNSAALDEIATSALDVATATLEQTGSQEAATAAITAGRDALILALAQLGITGTAAEAYADSLGLIPANINTAVAVTGVDAAVAQLNRIINSENLILGKAKQINPAGNLLVVDDGFAAGGPTGDNLSPTAIAGVVHGKEFVSTASTVADPSNRAALEYMHAGGSMTNYQSAPAPSYQSRTVTSPVSSSPVNVKVTNMSGLNTLKGLMRLEIEQNGVWQAVDLEGGVTQ